MTKDGKLCSVSCKCEKKYCFGCEKEPHAPLDCDLLEKWCQKIDYVKVNEKKPEETNEYWLQMNTKPCPKCKTPIEKNSGCMYMDCRKCGHGFCWLCLGDKKSHYQPSRGHFAACSSFAVAEKKMQAKKSTKVIDKAAKEETEKRELVRLEHYKTRFIAHQASIRFAEKTATH